MAPNAMGQNEWKLNEYKNCNNQHFAIGIA